jgi:hypothetical protein
MQITHNFPIFSSHTNCNIIPLYILYILEWLSSKQYGCVTSHVKWTYIHHITLLYTLSSILLLYFLAGWLAPTTHVGNSNTDPTVHWIKHLNVYGDVANIESIWTRQWVRSIWGCVKHITQNIPIFSSHTNYNIILMYILFILQWLSLGASREYVHSGLVLGLDWALCHLSSILYPPCLSWPTHQLAVCSNDSYFTCAPSLNK